MSYDNLTNWYRTTFLMLETFSNIALSDIHNMRPWERRVYITLLMNHIKEKQEEHERQMRTASARR